MRRCLALGVALATSVDGFLPAVRNVGSGQGRVTRMVLTGDLVHALRSETSLEQQPEETRLVEKSSLPRALSLSTAGWLVRTEKVPQLDPS